MKLKDLTGQKFNYLTVLKRVENTKKGQARWECKCKCGKTLIVRSTDLLSGVPKDGIFTENLNLECEFVCGYAKKDDKGKRIKAKINCIGKGGIWVTSLAIGVTPLEPYMSCGQPINKAQGSALGSLVQPTKRRLRVI